MNWDTSELQAAAERAQGFLNQPTEFGATTYVGKAYTLAQLRQDLLRILTHWDMQLAKSLENEYPR